MKRKVFAIILTLVLALILAACGGNGNITSNSNDTSTSSSSSDESTASASSPVETPAQTPIQTPSEEPPPTEPPHEHVWKKANYQEPQTCTECGEMDGAPVPAGFLSSGFTISPHDITHDYKTVTFFDFSLDIISQITFTDYRVFESDDEHPATEGYEWRVVNIYIENNEAAEIQENGIRIRCLDGLDYYDFKLDGTTEDSTEAGSWGDGTYYYTVNYHGVDYEVELSSELVIDEWVDRYDGGQWVGWTYYHMREFKFHVPSGYDGVLIVYYSAGNFDEETGGEHTYETLVDEDSIWFRLN